MLMIGLSACTSDSAGPPDIVRTDTRAGAAATLRQLAIGRGLRVGAAVGDIFRDPVAGSQFRSVLAREFSVLTPENDMKHIRLQPSRGVFNFARADSLVAFAEANRMRVHGHTLLWHNSNASWLTSGRWTPDEARRLLVDHVRTVVQHYRGQVASWDVVNEALDENGMLRSTIWRNLIGPDYVELAFHTAHAADPQALLFYNDFHIEGISAKSDSAYALISRLLDVGVPIHGIGMQGHFELGRLPPRESMIQNLARFAMLGLKVAFTEVDVRIPQPSSDADLRQQAEDYSQIFDVCLQNLACQMVTTWGVTDLASWIPRSMPGFGQPLLFDSAYTPKPAYWSVQQTLTRY